MRQGNFSPWSIWGWPLGLAGLILFGLLAALLGQEGIWLWLSWLALAFPLGVILFCPLTKRNGAADAISRGKAGT